MNKPINASNETFRTEVLQSGMPVLVDFYADWCGPCRLISPILDQIAEEAKDALRVVKLDVDNNGATAADYDVRSIPTLILFKDGHPVRRWIGVVSKAEIIESVRGLAPSVATAQRG